VFLYQIIFVKKSFDAYQLYEWIRKKWYIYIKEYYSAIKKNEILSLVSKIDGTEGHYVK
jgi:uncharacterized membrane protein YfhO